MEKVKNISAPFDGGRVYRASRYAGNGYSESTEHLAYPPPETTMMPDSDKLVVGSSQLFAEDGSRRCVPMPTPDPKDPLNLPQWRKWAAISTLCFFGALALAGELIIGALVPVFQLEYAGIDPKILGQIDLGAIFGGNHGGAAVNPVALLGSLGGPPVWKVALLSSLPLLMNGIASYFLVPLSIAIGRRPILLFVGIMAWSGGWWAGFSKSLEMHIAARCFQALGAGAVEALIPLIVQDIMFIHERNRAIASIGASQGLIIVSLGITTPLIITRLSWRWIYYLTAGAGMVSWLLMLLLVPETRWIRTPDELAGKEVYRLRPGEVRPRLDSAVFGPRTRHNDFGIFTVSTEWRLAGRSVIDTIKTTFFPNILWVILVNSILVSMQGATGQVGSTVFLASGLSFEKLGLIVLPIVVATPFVWFFGGYVADKISNAHARRNGGRREPEAHLISLVFPLAAGIVGPILFGYAGENIGKVPFAVTLTSIFLIGFGFITINTLFAVYLVESYPLYAGPVLVNVSSVRLIVGFGMSFNATSLVEDLGFFKAFSLYSVALLVACLFGPLVYIYGKRLRAWTGGKLDKEETDSVAMPGSGMSATDESELRAYGVEGVRSYGDSQYDYKIKLDLGGQGKLDIGQAR